LVSTPAAAANAASRGGNHGSNLGISQVFHGAKINTAGGNTSTAGGNIGTGNRGLNTQDFANSDLTTGGGDVGSNNTASDAPSMLPETLISALDGRDSEDLAELARFISALVSSNKF